METLAEEAWAGATVVMLMVAARASEAGRTFVASPRGCCGERGGGDDCLGRLETLSCGAHAPLSEVRIVDEKINGIATYSALALSRSEQRRSLLVGEMVTDRLAEKLELAQG